MVKLKDIIKAADLFGHTPGLNINRKEKHMTICGGLISFLVYIFMIGYFASLVYKMFLYNADSIQISQYHNDMSNFGEVTYKNSDYRIFHALTKANNHGEEEIPDDIYYSDDLYRKLDF